MQGAWRGYAIPALVAVLGLALSIFVYIWVERFEQAHITSEFDRRSANIARVLTSGIDGYVNLVYSYGNQTALFAKRMRDAGPEDFLRIREDWELFKPSIRQTVEDARRHYPGVRIMGWASKIRSEQLAEFESVARLLVDDSFEVRELGPDRTIVPVTDRPEYIPVFYAEPFEDASMLLGLDLGNSNKIGATLDAAVQRDEVAASEPIRMIRQVTGQLGFLMMVPVYVGGEHPQSAEKRQSDVYTFFFVVVLVEDMLNSALAGLDEPAINFFVYPGPEDLSQTSLTAQPVYASNGDPASIAELRGDPALNRHARQITINVAGQAWEMHAFPTRQFVLLYDTWMPEIVLILSGLFSLVVAGFLATYMGRADKVALLVSQRTRELEQANSALESEMDLRLAAEAQKRGLESQLYQAQRMDSIGNLAGGVAHDFNNILLAVLGYIELSRATDNLPEKVAGYLDAAKDAGDRAVTLTRQLLAFGRRQALAVAPHDINGVVAEFRHLLDRIVPENIRCTFMLAQDPCVVISDARQIEQVVMNLIVNACEAMPNGGNVRISTQIVELSTNDLLARPTISAGSFVRLSVSDTGAGISAEDLGRIFEPFYSTKSSRKGTGLGLAVVYGIVEQHGGFIEADSEVGRGAVFHVYLPRSNERARTATHLPAPVAEGGHETILVVEDELEVRELARIVLETAGYRVLLADSGHQGLELFNAHREEIALVFADVVMPEMGGRELTDAIRAIDPSKPVILTSGYLGDANDEFFLGKETNFLAKPYSPGMLRSEIRRVLDLVHSAAK